MPFTAVPSYVTHADPRALPPHMRQCRVPTSQIEFVQLVHLLHFAQEVLRFDSVPLHVNPGGIRRSTAFGRLIEYAHVVLATHTALEGHS